MGSEVKALIDMHKSEIKGLDEQLLHPLKEDKDKDGCISKEEFFAALSNLSLIESEGEKGEHEEGAEFTEEEVLNGLFDHFDDNEMDECLDASEVKALVNDFKYVESKAPVLNDHLLLKEDANGDGCLSKEEF